MGDVFSYPLGLDVVGIEAGDLKEKVEGRARHEDGDPFSIRAHNPLSNPIEGEENQTDDNRFEQNVHKTDCILARKTIRIRMRNLHNALADTLTRFQPQLNWRILPDPDVPTRWRVQVWAAEESLLEVEILNLEGDAVGCVLDRRNISFRTMQRFMDTLMGNLEDAPPNHPPGGEPPYV